MRHSNKILSLIIFTFIVFHAVGQAPTPCACCNEKARQFHFWAGDWETFNPAGKLVGTNHIVVMQNGCTMQENWASAGSVFTGTSYNYYDPATDKWNQVWIDNMGGNLQLEGGLVGKEMILKSKAMNGRPKVDRITWTPNSDGTVRQKWETSTDQEKTWTVAFDGLYKKVDSR